MNRHHGGNSRLQGSERSAEWGSSCVVSGTERHHVESYRLVAAVVPQLQVRPLARGNTMHGGRVQQYKDEDAVRNLPTDRWQAGKQVTRRSIKP